MMNSNTNASMTAAGSMEGGHWMTLTPTQDGGFCFFFGSIPQPVTLVAPISTQPVYASNSIQGAEVNNDGQVSEEPTLLSKRQKKRLRAARAALKKRETVQQVAVQQVTMPNISISNAFAPLRWVRKNSPAVQLKNPWELPALEVQQAPELVPSQKTS